MPTDVSTRSLWVMAGFNASRGLPACQLSVDPSAVRFEGRALRTQLLSFSMRGSCISPPMASPVSRRQRRAARRESLFLVAREEPFAIAVGHLANLDRFRGELFPLIE